MAIKKKSSGGGGANWMDTYGDMVTLLMCFFVLLYSMSTISEDKWKAIVQSFNPSSIVDAAAISGNEGPIDGPDNMGTGELEMGPDEITIEEVVEKELQAMDLTASIMCKDYRMPMLVFALDEENSIINTVHGNFHGTRVTV